MGDSKGYGDFKGDLAEIVANEIAPIQERYNQILNSNELNEVLDKGREDAKRLAFKKMRKVYRKIGVGRN